MADGTGGRIAMVGLGEAGRAFVSGWGDAVAGRVAAYDIKVGDPGWEPPDGVPCHAGPAPALARAGLVFCLVTADGAVEAARACAPALARGAIWLDGNSCAPGTKRHAAELIEAAGGRYVDMAIMSPVQPRLHRTPALLSGPHAATALAALGGLGMNLRLAGDAIGQASAIKMLRSVIIKGIEAITAESLLAARRAGVEGEVLASLQASDPGLDWHARGAYNLERMLVHGTRRAAEMREVALTLRELGLPDRMTQATVDWQAELGALGTPAGPDDLIARLDAILADLA